MKKHISRYIKIYWIKNLQDIFINGFIYEEFLKKTVESDIYILEILHKKDTLFNVSHIQKVYFSSEEQCINFKITTFWNLPIYDKILEINLDVFSTREEVFFSYETEKIKYCKSELNTKMWLLTALYYFMNLKRTDVIEMHGLNHLYWVQDETWLYEEMYNFYKNYFDSQNIKEIKSYKDTRDFVKVAGIFYVLGLIFNKWSKNWDSIKIIPNDKTNNMLSIFYKIIKYVTNNSMQHTETYWHYLENLITTLSLDYYEKWYLSQNNKRYLTSENLDICDYLLLIIKTESFNAIIADITKFNIKKELQEHVLLICYILKWIFEWYSWLEKEIKIVAYENHLFDIKKSWKVKFDKNKLVLWKLSFNIF